MHGLLTNPHRPLVQQIGTMAEQTERSFQKQAAVFGSGPRSKSKIKTGSKGRRYIRNVGLGFKAPKEAVEGVYVDKNCPFTGNVSIRGRILKASCALRDLNLIPRLYQFTYTLLSP